MRNLEREFTHHPPRSDQDVKFYERMRSQAFALAEYIDEHVSESHEKNVALDKVNEAVMWANAARARAGGHGPE